jgi:hypothetical protein
MSTGPIRRGTPLAILVVAVLSAPASLLAQGAPDFRRIDVALAESNARRETPPTAGDHSVFMLTAERPDPATPNFSFVDNYNDVVHVVGFLHTATNHTQQFDTTLPIPGMRFPGQLPPGTYDIAVYLEGYGIDRALWFRVTTAAGAAPIEVTARKADIAQLQQATEHGEAAAALRLAVVYQEGDGAPPDLAAAHLWVCTASILSFPDMSQLVLDTASDIEAAMTGAALERSEAECGLRLQRIAASGNSRAEAMLGTAYLLGGIFRSIHKDVAQAVVWFSKGAEHGQAHAQLMLGDLYLQGTGVTRDPTTAIAWVRRSAEQGYPPAESALGGAYASGNGVPQDGAQAVAWLRKASDQGNTGADHMLADMYEKGTVVPQDFTESVRWLRKAADLEDRVAEYSVGVAYGLGRGVPLDHAQEAQWYHKAADHKYAPAQFNLGYAYENGLGVPQDREQAVLWYRKAADQGNASAQVNLGVAYANGAGVPADPVEAYKWISIAVPGASRDNQSQWITIRDTVAARLTPEQLADGQRRAREWMSAFEKRTTTAAAPPPAEPIRIDGNPQQPTKITDVKPEYPAIAVSARVQGVVIVEATIGADGKVKDAKVVQGIPLLDAAALAAVRQWEFTPTLLNGAPVPVITTVTVTFSLK